jgi:hypothetical protein
MQLGHNYIGTEHILLGLIREGEGIAAQVLVRLGADLSRVRQEVISLLGARVVETELPRFGGMWRRMSRGDLADRLAEIADRLSAIEARLGIVRPERGTPPGAAQAEGSTGGPGPTGEPSSAGEAADADPAGEAGTDLRPDSGEAEPGGSGPEAIG